MKHGKNSTVTQREYGMETISAIDARENISALAVAILYKEFVTVENAFSLLDKNKKEFGAVSGEELFNLKREGLTEKEIAKVVGTRSHNVERTIANYEKRLKVSQS